MRIPVGIEKVLYLAAIDPAFRERLFADRPAALGDAGLGLLDDEAAVLRCIPDDQLAQMIANIDPAAHGRKRFMQKVAACAVALAATTAGAGCEKSRHDVTPEQRQEQTDASVKVDSSTVDLLRGAGGVTTLGARGVPTAAEIALDVSEGWAVGTAGSRGIISGKETNKEPRIVGDISLGTCTVEGSIDPVKISGVIKARLRSVQDCYERELKRTPSLAGEIMIGFSVDENGKVEKAEAISDSLGNPAVVDCILGRLRHWKFPKPESGTATVKVPFRFSPGADASVGSKLELDPSDEKTIGGMGMRAGSGGAAKVKLGVPEVEGYTDLSKVTGTIEAGINPVKTCFENELKQSQDLQGYVELRFTIGKNGNVSAARVSEETLGNPVVVECSLSELKRMRFPKPDQGKATVTICFGFSKGR